MITKPEEIMYIIQINVPQIKRLVASTSKEKCVLHYHGSIEDNIIESIEHFKDSEVTLAHLQNF